MLALILIIGAVFIVLGLILNENNAHYLLNGYRNLSEERKKFVRINELIPFYKNFHLYLGIIYIALGLFIYLFIDKNYVAGFAVLFPILAYIYFAVRTREYFTNGIHKMNSLSVAVLLGALLFVSILFYFGFKENRLLIRPHGIEITGMYGEDLPYENIHKVFMINEIPGTRYRQNGFSLHDIKKGYFLTKENESVKFILNKTRPPYILIITTEGQKIYYSAKSDSTKYFYEQIKPLFQ